MRIYDSFNKEAFGVRLKNVNDNRIRSSFNGGLLGNESRCPRSERHRTEASHPFLARKQTRFGVQRESVFSRDFNEKFRP